MQLAHAVDTDRALLAAAGNTDHAPLAHAGDTDHAPLAHACDTDHALLVVLGTCARNKTLDELDLCHECDAMFLIQLLQYYFEVMSLLSYN